MSHRRSSLETLKDDELVSVEGTVATNNPQDAVAYVLSLMGFGTSVDPNTSNATKQSIMQHFLLDSTTEDPGDARRLVVSEGTVSPGEPPSDRKSVV